MLNFFREHNNKAVQTFKGPLIFVSFYSDSGNQGNGFTLRFQGQGNSSAGDSTNSVRYSNYNFKDTKGNLSYPEDRTTLYQPNELATFVINPNNPPGTSVRLYLTFTDMEKEQSCEYDSVSFYGSVKASFALTKRYVFLFIFQVGFGFSLNLKI